MKSEEGKSWQRANGGVELNIQPAIIETLKTVLLLERPRGIAYLGIILRGVETQNWSRPVDKTVETFGVLKEMTRDYVSRVIHFLVDEGLLTPTNSMYNALAITDKGRDYLENPFPVFLDRNYLRCTPSEAYLFPKLRAFRREMAQRLNMEEWGVFTDFVLDRIVMAQPVTLEALQHLPGMNEFKVEQMGEGIIAIVQDARNNHEEIAKRRASYISSKPDHKFVRRMVEEGRSLDEVVKAISFELWRIESILKDLHLTGEIDVRTWIETFVDSKQLFRGTEYFRKAGGTSIREAVYTLNLPVGIVHMCRLYVDCMEATAAA